MVKIEWHDQDYLHLKWHVVRRELATRVLNTQYPKVNVILFFFFNRYDLQSKGTEEVRCEENGRRRQALIVIFNIAYIARPQSKFPWGRLQK